MHGGVFFLLSSGSVRYYLVDGRGYTGGGMHRVVVFFCIFSSMCKSIK